MAILSVIRHWRLREGRFERLRDARNQVVEPRYAKRSGVSELDGYAAKRAGWLKTEAS